MSESEERLISVNVLLLDWTLSKLLGKENVTIKLRESEATIKGLIEMLDKGYNGKVREAILRPNINISIFVNGRDIEFLRGINTGLSNGDRVAIIPLVAGG